MTIAISIPVHEHPEVVINQIENFRKYIPNALLVFHVRKSNEFSLAFIENIRNYPRVFINPESVDCDWNNIIWAHISNYKYISAKADFDYFMMHASNDMYILPGMEAYIARYDAGFHVHKIVKPSRWWPGNEALKDKDLKTIMSAVGATSIIATQVESSFYKKELFGRMVEILGSITELRNNSEILRYTREEVYFSTMAYALVDHPKIGYPTTFSEVHRFDRYAWRISFLCWGIYHRLGFCKFIRREKYDAFEKACFDYLIKHKCGRLRISDINRIRDHATSFYIFNRFLNDGVSRYQLYGDQLFSVKRVGRDMNDALRKYINSL